MKQGLGREEVDFKPTQDPGLMQVHIPFPVSVHTVRSLPLPL